MTLFSLIVLSLMRMRGSKLPKKRVDELAAERLRTTADWESSSLTGALMAKPVLPLLEENTLSAKRLREA